MTLVIHTKVKIGTRVWFKRKKGVISSGLIGPDCAGDHMCPPPAYEVTFEDGTKQQIEPKDLRARPRATNDEQAASLVRRMAKVREKLKPSRMDDKIKEIVANMTPEAQRRFVEYAKAHPYG